MRNERFRPEDRRGGDRRATFRRRYLAALAVFALAGTLYLAGALRLVDNELLEMRFALTERPATSDLVIVAIDPDSLEQLGTWPWPRGYHAQVVDRLLDAGAARIAFDIDFSSVSDPQEDARFAAALERAGDRAVLAAFKQRRRKGGAEAAMVLTEPLPAFRQGAALASVSIQPDPDGVVRRLRAAQSWHQRPMPALPLTLAAGGDDPLKRFGTGSFHIDFGIRPETIPVVSFADVVTGDFDPALVSGRAVLIGATAVQLGDQLPVPRWKILPGVQVLGLAYQSLVQDRALERAAPWAVLALTLVIALAFGPRAAVWGWRRGLAGLAAITVGVAGAAIGAQFAGVIFDGTAPVLAAALCFVGGVISRSNWQALLLRSQRREIRHKETMMNGVVCNSFDAIMVLDDAGLIEEANPAAEEVFAARADDLVGRHIVSLIPNATKLLPRLNLRAAPMPDIHRHEMTAHRPDGSQFPVEIAMREMTTDSGCWHIGFVRDITERKANEQALEHQALHDALTGLPNRTLLYKRLRESIRKGAGEAGEHFALLILDLNRFKEVNDTLGHHIGDVLLRRIAGRLGKPLRKTDTIARLGGDEFAILLSPVSDRDTVASIAHRLHKVLEAPVRCNGLTLDVGGSIGAAIFPDDGNDAAELIQKADIAMYMAKDAGKAIAFYDPEKDHNSVRHLTLTGELKRAIDEQDLQLYYQPKISLATKQVVGAESLLRWHHAEHGFIPPDEFVALAEQTGLIRKLTEWVLGTALAQAARWRDAGLNLDIAVNLSARILQDTDLPGLVDSLLAEHGIAPQRLILEITESAIMADPERAKSVIDAFTASGVRLSIDDFGTGYSSLGYLKRLPVDELKIDKSFVMEMVDSESDQVIVKSTVDLAHNLGLKVVAEGVETDEVLARLAALGTDIAQGYFISRPVPAGDFEEWFVNWNKAGVEPRLEVVAGGAC